MTERDQFGGAFGAQDAGQLCDGQHIPLLQCALADQLKGGLLHPDFAACDGHALALRLFADIHHMGAPFAIQMGKDCGHAEIIP